jgi:hypothetical protein
MRRLSRINVELGQNFHENRTDEGLVDRRFGIRELP